MLYIENIQTPIDLLELHEQFPARYPHLLQSCNSTNINNQYDILFAQPRASIELWNDGLRLVNAQYLPKKLLVNQDDNFLDTFCAWFKTEANQQQQELPFTGGWFTYLSYEFAQSVEQHALHLSVLKDVPIAFVTRFEEAIIIDRKTGEAILVSEKNDQDVIAKITNDIKTLANKPAVKQQQVEVLDIKEDESLVYIEGVNKIKRYIKEGDVFQVNLSRQWDVQLKQAYTPASLYRKLRQANPAPFSGLMTHTDFAIASSSPERLVSTYQGQVEVRPIAGTRPRNNSKDKDKALIEELSAHPKEKAEHIMLIDLERNDLGRICKPGSIDVNELMTVESFEHVHHLVSNVIGQMRADITPDQVIKAVFPGGTITGCPKVRCMQILKELEQTPRSSYTGSMGYINSNGDMDLNILIRGMQIKDDKLIIRAGAGIVADSIAHKEVAETRSKAKGMLAALGIDIKTPQGLLETFRVIENQSIPLWQYHKTRLLRGLKTYGIDKNHIYLIEREVFDCLKKPGIYRLAVQVAQHSVISISVSKREELNLQQAQKPWQLIICHTNLPKDINPNSVKLLQRDIYQIAYTEITKAKVDDGILLSENGNIIETTICNIFCIKDNMLYTPNVSSYGVDGVMKHAIIDYCQREKITVKQENMNKAFLQQADHVFLCNSIRGIINVAKINTQQYSIEHPLLGRLLNYTNKLFI